MKAPILSAFIAATVLSSFAHGQDACSNLAGLKVPNTILTAQTVAAGTFNGPPQVFSGRDISAFYKSLPTFCRVVADAKPTSDSDIKIEIWLPVSNWNGRLQALGNGGFAGLIDTQSLGLTMKAGYAATATDAGHTGTPEDARWALGHPEKISDFGHRGVHEMTRVAKAVIQAYYGKAAQHSYFAGCSDGGREALMEAQRYPEDFDGILAGAPANNWTGLLSMSAYNTQALTADPASFIPPAKIATIGKAVNAACDELDGVKDGILNDPRACHFDPATIQCKAGHDSDDCLTAPQAEVLKKLYAGLHDTHGHELHAGYLPGAEEGGGGWGLWITGPAPNKSLMAYFAYGYFANMVYDKGDWSPKSFEVDRDFKTAFDRTANALDANNPNLKAFAADGGKLILYHGWNDPAIPAMNTVEYYDRVLSTTANADSFVRLYMVPGMQHCGGGPGTDYLGTLPGVEPSDAQHSLFTALQTWVEKGTVPGALAAAHYTDEEHTKSTMTRPLCAYPQTAKYNSGDPNAAASFTCVAPK